MYICIQQTDDIYEDIGEDIEKTFATSNYELEYWITNSEYFLSKTKNKKIIGLWKINQVKK